MHRRVALVWLAALLMAGCGRSTPAGQQVDANHITDSWYRPPTAEFLYAADTREQDPNSFVVVVTKVNESLARSERSPAVELTEPEVQELIGKPIGGSGGRIVLLRALSWDTPHGAFTVSWRPGAVRVSHGCLGRHPPPTVRRAVVARLPNVPGAVYVDLVMAE